MTFEFIRVLVVEAIIECIWTPFFRTLFALRAKTDSVPDKVVRTFYLCMRTAFWDDYANKVTISLKIKKYF